MFVRPFSERMYRGRSAEPDTGIHGSTKRGLMASMILGPLEEPGHGHHTKGSILWRSLGFLRSVWCLDFFFSSIKLGSKIFYLTEAPTQNLGDWQATKDLNTMIVMPPGKCWESTEVSFPQFFSGLMSNSHKNHLKGRWSPGQRHSTANSKPLQW